MPSSESPHIATVNHLQLRITRKRTDQLNASIIHWLTLCQCMLAVKRVTINIKMLFYSPFAWHLMPTPESPFYLLHRREPLLPIDAAILQISPILSLSIVEFTAWIIENLENDCCIVKSNTESTQLRMKEQYVIQCAGSIRFGSTNRNGDRPLQEISTSQYGSYYIMSKLSPVHFKLQTLDNLVSVLAHANRM